MINITESKNCCGCTACANICPTNCISMKADDEGFLYPEIDTKKCINCSKCQKACPNINPKTNDEQSKAFCMRTKDIDVLKNSTSGGFFTPISEYVIENNGVVVGAAFTKSKRIDHILVSKDNKSEIALLRGSKYVQSYLGDTFSKIKELLQQGVTVCFSGTPCQVAGLHCFLGKKYDNLITVDLICHSTPSPKLWRKYIEYQENKYKSEVKEVSFRKKTYGYHSGTMELVFENGKRYHGSGRVDFMLKSFYKGICSRPSCYSCQFKTANHVSDFTIFDSWSAAKLVPGLKDDNLGYTNVFINTAHGMDVFNTIKDRYEFYEIDMEQAIKMDGIMVRNRTTPHPKRDEYYKNLDNHDIKQHVQEFLPITAKDHLFERMKGLLYKFNILYYLKKIKRALKKRKATKK